MKEQKLNEMISRNIVKLLEEKNRTQAELSEFLGVSQSAVSFWCNGSKTPRMDKIDKMCDFFGCPRASIIGGNSDSFVRLNAREKRLLAYFRKLTDAEQRKTYSEIEDMVFRAEDAQ